jgi:hypothetical protein
MTQDGPPGNRKRINGWALIAAGVIGINAVKYLGSTNNVVFAGLKAAFAFASVVFILFGLYRVVADAVRKR